MKELKKRIPLKYLYVLSACIAVLLSVGLYYTYAMFTANVSSGNVVNMDTTLNYTFDVSGTQSFHVGKGSIASFNFIVNNSSSGAIYYEIYYSSSNDLTNVIIAEVVEDKTITTTAQNTGSNIDKDNRKTIPLVIANNSDNDIDIVIGVVTGYVGNTINYGTDNYPNGTKITSTYNSSDIKNSCASNIDASGSDCTKKIVSGHLITYCPVEDVELQEDPTGANRPVLAEGMIPITYNGSTWVKADSYGAYSDWYDYGNKKWANAALVSSSTRSTYMSANTGTEVKEDDILAYYVWIPRYKYKLFNVDFVETTYNTDGTCTANCPQVIDVVFESGTNSTGTTKCSVSEIGVETCTNKENGNYYTHPAFTFGDTELEGLWVGKFETTGTADSPTIKPGIRSLYYLQNVSTQFITSQKFNSTNYLSSNGIIKADAHMMKNIEWGAVAYLKQSNYGLGLTDITGNYSSFLAGSASYKTNIEQSTTGNITGVYDMSGGANEYVMGVMQDNTTDTRSPMSGYSTSDNSGYVGKVGNSYTDSGNTLAFPEAKYYDLYANGNSYLDHTRGHLGDATGEVAGERSGWYHDWSLFVFSSYPWFFRGGSISNSFDGEGVFQFVDSYGNNPNCNVGFRISLTVTE